ncbi:O-antigen ligase family protein [Vibrio europaeus]|uniref:O-antigen ligase family protein n=1 Tax=Vibrio europaeus TaxID=300876 RepID=UPI0023416B27|nr:O-antigen ligase family protein [Vibrio europaeus]MDC5837991.1 O-antigen ligase family protein [Vibrio europaeus]
MLLVPALLLTTSNFSVAVIAIAILLSLVYLYLNRSHVAITKFDIVVTFCLSIYFIGAIPIVIYDGTTARYFQGGGRLLLCIPIYYALKTHLSKHQSNYRIYFEIGLIIGTIGAFALAYYQHFIIKMPRVDGFLFSINFGYLACSLSFLALTFALESKLKVLLVIGFMLSIIATIFTYTRGAIFAIPILLVLLVIININRFKKRHITLGCLTLFLAIFTLYNNSTNFKNRIDYTYQEFSLIASGNIGSATSSGYRLQYWYGAFEAFKANPLFGLPYSKREELNHQLYLDKKISKGASKITRGHAHNQYFEMLATNGFFGLLSIFGVLVAPLLIFFRHYVKYKTNWSLSATLFVSGFAIYGLTEVPLTANLIGSFYGFMLAIFFANVSAEKYHWEKQEKQ